MTSAIEEGSPNSDPIEDDFLIALIDSVQRNPCIYNRYNPLHKFTEHKLKIWKMISAEVGYDGQLVELERKWKHMRDKYVRLRKQDKMRAPIKETDKWYNYYQKMSFLDPYIEHRNRKRQMDRDSSSDILDEDAVSLDEINTTEQVLTQDISNLLSPKTSSSTSTSGSTHGSNLNSPDQEMKMDVKKLAHPYDKMFDEADGNPKTVPLLTPPIQNGNASHQLPQHTEVSRSRKRKATPTKIITESSSSPENAMKESILKEMLEDQSRDEVSVFIRIVSQTLSNMDRREFETARLEISKVLHKIELDQTD